MRLLKLIILGLLVVMSLAAGAAKVMQTPQEATFFKNVSLSLELLVPFGVFQIAAAVLSAIPKTRVIGLGLMALAFLASAIMVFMSGNAMFGGISLIPAVLAIWLAIKKPAS